MDAAPSPMGVAASSSSLPEWPQTSQWVASPGELSIRLPSDPAKAWSWSAQVAAALFLSLALLLLGWHAWSVQRGRCRPAVLESNELTSSTVDLNQADHAQLLQLPGIGDNLALRIEKYRAEHGGFREVDELRQVHGIGPKMLEKLRGFVHVEKARSDEEDDPPTQPARLLPMQTVHEKKPLLVRKDKATVAEPIDVNHASAVELQRLPGIGPVLSQRIIEVRAKQPFRSIEDLRRVRGIGAKTLERLRSHILVKR